MAEILNDLPTPQAGKSAVKCLSQGHNRKARIDYNRDHTDHNHGNFNHLTTLPTAELNLCSTEFFYSVKKSLK